ncbi:MAG: VWA domain-containing protein [Phycisphaerales bacterium]|nr:VWA domain-containing protein [Phycisphaerales bacterium]
MFSGFGNLLAQADRVEIERRFEWAALPESWSALAMLALVALLLFFVVYMYRHEGRAGASQRVRAIMATLRCAVVLVIAAIWLEPVLATYLHRLIDSYTIVLVDTSSSMDLQDRYRRAEDLARVRAVAPDAGEKPVRRSQLVEDLFAQGDHALLRELSANNRVRVFTFSDRPAEVFTLRAQREAPVTTDKEAKSDSALVLNANAVANAPLRFPAQGAVTDIGTAVRRAVDSLGRAPIAGVVLLTDGEINRGESVEAIADFARERRIALHVVGVGDPAPPHNVRMAEVMAPDNVFADDPFAIVAQIASEGMAGETVNVELIERRADGDDEGTVVATKSVTLGTDGSIEPLSFDHRQNAVGRFTYRVHVPVGETESVADDNSKQVTVNIIENKLRVLLVAGSPSWDYRYLSRLLERDRTFQTSCWLQSADVDAVRDGNVVIDHLPATAEELFEYDAIILLDPDPFELTADWAELVSDLVTEHGGGLIYEAARQFSASFLRDPATEPVRRILPVTFDNDAELILNQIGHYQQQGYPLVVPPTAAGHPILKLPVGDDQPFNWAGIGAVYWHLPVLREKPVATVLMRHGDPRMQNAYGAHVLFATQYAGAGRTAFLGFDGTWRWRSQSETIFNKFWVQTIRYLVEGKLAGGNRRGTILTDLDTYQLGAAVQVTARLFDRSFKPLQLPEVTAQYKLDGEPRELVLTRNNDRPGWYAGSFVPPRTGSCELTLPIPGDDVGEDVARREIQIVRPNLEILKPQLDREGLQLLANASPDGRYYDIDEVAALPAAIPDRHESTTIRSRPVPLWDDSWVLVVLVALLAAEWSMRKVFRLL